MVLQPNRVGVETSGDVMPSSGADARALSIRQPWAELICLGKKVFEIRSRPTRIVGETFYIYASKSRGPAEVYRAHDLNPETLPSGLLVATAIIRGCREVAPAVWHWELADVRRLSRPVPPSGHPQPVWFRPFARTGFGDRPARLAS